MADSILPLCKCCQKEIDARLFSKSGGRRKFCSRSCAIAYRPIAALIRTAKDCEHCGKNFKAKSATKTRFCCKDCSISANKASPRKCKNCLTVFSPIRWLAHKNRFISDRANNRDYCSKECRLIFVKTGKEKQCASCKVWFTPIRRDARKNYYTPYDLPTTCGHECYLSAYPISEEKRKAASERMSGSNHPNWQGGSHRSGYRGSGWNALAEKIRNRAGRKCEKCGVDEADCETRLHVNHKIPFHQSRNKKAANNPSNLEALCVSCHMKTDWAWRKEHPMQIVMPFH